MAAMIARMVHPDPRRLPAPGPLIRILALIGVAVVVGALASLGAIAFVEAVGWMNDALLISPRTRVQHAGSGWLAPAATVAVPALGGLLVGALLARGARGAPLGPPAVIRAVQFRERLPSGRRGAVSTAAAAVSLGFGASVGQYGPMVYLGAMVGEAAGRLGARIPNLPAIAMACGVASAIATAFNAPIAGLVFAHEVVLRHWATQAFAPTTVAAVIGWVIATLGFERAPLFLVEFDGVARGYEFALFALLGALSAGVAMLFMGLVLRAGRAAASSRLPASLRPGAAGLALGLTALWLPDVLGVGAEALRFATIEGAYAPGELALLVAAKMAVTALCVGFGFAGGVFSPALLIGVLSGALAWTGLAAAGLPVSHVAVYAICAMMAVASPVIGAPLTTILIVFELTRNYDLTVAAMVSVVVSNLIAHRLFGRSLFDVQLARAGVDLSAGRDRAQLAVMPVARCLAGDFPALRLEEPLAAATARLRASEWLTGFVVDADGVFHGVLREPDAVAASPGARVADLLRPAAVVLGETTSVLEAMRRLEGFVGDGAPLVDAEGRLRGVVTESAVLGAYLEVSQRLREEENAAL